MNGQADQFEFRDLGLRQRVGDRGPDPALGVVVLGDDDPAAGRLACGSKVSWSIGLIE